MLDRRLSGLEKHLRREPEDRAAWVELAHLSERLRNFPDFVRADHLPRLLEIWGAAADDRALGFLVLPLLELELVRDRSLAPGDWWRTSGRLGDAGDHWFDRVTGMPLQVLHAKTGIEMLWIPPGAFFMGGAAYAEETPIHRVELGGYWMARTPTTVESLDAFLQGRDAELPEDWERQLEEPDRPAVFVDWFTARAFCAWAGTRLPTEAEWERAARGTDGRLFPWGDASPSGRLANFNQGGRKLRDWDRHLVDAGAVAGDRSPFGVADMGGNVVEWCQDWYDPGYYAASPVEDPRGPRTGQEVSVRGNSWLTEADWDRFRTSVRKSQAPHARHPWLGFRMARALLPG